MIGSYARSTTLEGEREDEHKRDRHPDSLREPDSPSNRDGRHDQERPLTNGEVLRSLHIRTLGLAGRSMRR